MPLPLLWQAFEPPDPATNRSRGYILLQKTEELYETFFHVALNPQQWCATAAPYLADKLPVLLEKSNSLDEVVVTLMQHLPVEFASLLQSSTHSTDMFPALREAIQVNPLFAIVQEVVSSQQYKVATIAKQWSLLDKVGEFTRSKINFAQWLTILLLTCPQTLYKALKPELQAWFNQVRNPAQFPEPLNREVTRLQEQMSALQEFCSVSG